MFIVFWICILYFEQVLWGGIFKRHVFKVFCEKHQYLSPRITPAAEASQTKITQSKITHSDKWDASSLWGPACVSA